MKNNTLSYRVGELEKIVCVLDGKIDKLMLNEVPHLMQTLNEIKEEGFKVRSDIKSLRVLVFLNVGAIIVGILIAKYL